MLILTKKMIIILFVIIVNLFTFSYCQDIISPTCDNNANFTTNSRYQSNLDNALSSLTSDTSIRYGFYNRSVGQSPDQANAYGLCRGDVEPNDCRSCINEAITTLRGICPNQRGAIGWYDKCMLRYSNDTILGNSDQRLIRGLPNANNASNPSEFNQGLDSLLDQLRTEASRGGPLRKYAANTTNGPGFSTIYGYMQCTPDLTEDQCYNCLESAMGFIPGCCAGRRGGRVYFPSCILRYESSRFLNDTVALTSPSPPPTGSSTPPPSPPGDGDSDTTTIVVIAVVASVSVVILVVVFVCVFMRMRRKRKLRGGHPPENLVHEDRDIDEISTAESLQYGFGVIRAATSDFSDSNKLGQGGFGMVYKGKLQNGQEIAVKRLSRDSGQGEQEFKNEVLLLARLQHRNLVRLLGFSLEGSERLLMYEFVQNASLDQFIFDPLKRGTLDWERRYKIIGGIARGLLYLHEDSRLKIIHRDLKASNILLDAQMNPKIADFGMARLFTTEETQANTSRIVGTYGYMAPEYAMHGQFSVKSDVFSFGVLILEIVTGQKNHTFQNGMMVEDLLSHAWKCWRDGTASSLIDPTLCTSSLRDMLRCIHIGLLCVQEDVNERPTMASVVLMLSSASLTLPVPSEPAFFMRTSTNPEKPLFEQYTSSTGDPNQLKSKSRSSRRSVEDNSISDDLYSR
uniref:cysteine-rich receptor-like protein kinase 15 n=1 Tax=Erigeron canadensis TaxID=72917 RepID=UPI001CB8D48A|nr:cysteine-rich receptor-like protein kinase 15 [Erigeron canadensis]